MAPQSQISEESSYRVHSIKKSENIVVVSENITDSKIDGYQQE